MPKLQPTFTAEFKHEAVQLVNTSHKPKSQIARELGISDSALYSWCKAAEAHGEDAFPGKGHQLPLEEEVHRLRRELERAQQERDILKKQSCLSETPMIMKIGSGEPVTGDFVFCPARSILSLKETLRSRPRQWSREPDKKAG